jgi:opacity protein-like surface antigen
MLTNIKYSGWLRGNYEVLLEGFIGPFYQGPGTLLGGFTIQGRYNFVQPGNRWIPYLQLGLGGLYNDAFHHREQIEIGSGPEFNLQTGAGMIYFLNRNWAVVGEFGYRHISDAETSTRNTGVNSLGGLFGFSYYF